MIVYMKQATRLPQVLSMCLLLFHTLDIVETVCECCTCQPVPDALILNLPDARGLSVDIADGCQLMSQLNLLAAEANGIWVVWTQWLRLTVHLLHQRQHNYCTNKVQPLFTYRCKS